MAPQDCYSDSVLAFYFVQTLIQWHLPGFGLYLDICYSNSPIFLVFTKTSTCISRKTYLLIPRITVLISLFAIFFISVCLIVHIAGTRP